jgi:acyl-CoA thioesterase YciA
MRRGFRRSGYRDAGRHNPYGGVFGGWLMGQMGLACGSFASGEPGGASGRGGRSVPGAMAVGDELSVYVELLKQGRTSLRLKPKRSPPADGEKEQIVAGGAPSSF